MGAGSPVAFVPATGQGTQIWRSTMACVDRKKGDKLETICKLMTLLEFNGDFRHDKKQPKGAEQ